jgi:hypothetical protein
MVEQATVPAGSEWLVGALFTSAEYGDSYRDMVKKNPDYARQLDRLEATELMAQGLVTHAKRRIADAAAESGRAASGQTGGSSSAGDLAGKDDPAARQAKRADQVVDDMNSSYSLRFSKRGLIYLSELDALRMRVKSQEVQDIAELLEGKKRTKALTPEEMAALVDGDFGPPGDKVVPPLETRLVAVPALSMLDDDGNFVNIHRIVGPGELMTGETHFFFGIARPINALVGTIGPPQRYDERGGERQRVIPLNDEAIRVLGKYTADYTIAVTNLAPVRPDDFPKPAKAKTP